ncbi:MAG: hypothetical protein JSW30_01275 [Dehalococcoidia bacterium]|nr:MAG: hypothetical protein JSW30_01275 [Dehalococcoidia bacterium]
MATIRQLYQLQEIELEIESDEHSLQQITSQLGQNQAVVKAQNKLADEQSRLEELKRQQNSAEWEIDDITTKLKTTEEQLYSGRIGNPKELASLQQEAELLKAKRDHVEDGALEIIDKVELAEAEVKALEGELEATEADWQSQQKQLADDKGQLETKIAELKQKQQQLLAGIEPQLAELYYKLKQNKGKAVAKIEQGICRGCRISLPTAELQQARSGQLVQCSSCGRILFLA